MRRLLPLYAAIVLIGLPAYAVAQIQILKPLPPEIEGESKDGQRALARFVIPKELTGQLFAAEPTLANPVAIDVVDRYRVLVCETFRQGQGVEDNRAHKEWVDDDLAAQTVEDRRAYIKKHLKGRAVEYMRNDDRVRLLRDTDGDGRADKSTVFANHFNDIVSGTGAGVLAHQGVVYYTCVPDLWRLKDINSDDVADDRTALLSGFGVRFAYRGHDLHGLTVGPDGRLYFSIGDRGYHVEAGGKRFANPESGAIFRCELDGSNFEVVHTGLRNPQEIAFDDYGNLFTGDNNSDSGDKARWVYVVEGGDSGWRMAYQYLTDRGPFNREKLWHLYHQGQPAYIVPPVAHIAAGPAGLAYYPGTGLPEEFQGRFFLCDFCGGAANSGIRSFRVKPKGAFFELVDSSQPFWYMLATDVDFGPDGAIYVSDWVHGWYGLGKGRIYRFFAPKQVDTVLVLEVGQLLAADMNGFATERLVQLLGHVDRRVRLKAQFALASKQDIDVLQRATQDGRDLFRRLHAVWALGQIARSGGQQRATLIVFLLTDLSQDDDAEVRAQATGMLADTLQVVLDQSAGRTKAVRQLTERLQDDSLRVRHFAAMALGKIGRQPEVVPPLLKVLINNAGEDPILRHSAVMGLDGAATDEQLSKLVNHPSKYARMGVLLAMRRRSQPAITGFLDDADSAIVEEAARAIHDVPIAEGLPALAALIDRPLHSDALLRRVLNANYRMGGRLNAVHLAEFAAHSGGPEVSRVEAIQMLAAWEKPSPRDRVLGMWRPLSSRDKDVATAALRPHLARIVSGTDMVCLNGIQVAVAMGIREVGPALHQLLADRRQSVDVRREAVLALSVLKDSQLRMVADRALGDDDPLVRIAGRQVLVGLDPDRALGLLEQAIYEGQTAERQAALATLAEMPQPKTEDIILRVLDKLSAGVIPADTQMDVMNTASRFDTDDVLRAVARFEQRYPKDDPLAAFRMTLVGGDPERGRDIFFARGDLSCVRCHKINGKGGDVGPDLSKIAAEKQREYLLESLVLPNKSIAKGYEPVTVATLDGRLIGGIVKREDAQSISLMSLEGEMIVIDKNDVEDLAAGKSAMPEDMVKHLSKSDLRDLVEFLSSLR